MDFIEKLPSSSSFNTILVIVDWLSKQAIFIPTHDTITSAELACLFVTHVFSKYRVLSHVTSNHSSEFVSHFFRSLGTALDMRLHFTSGYHPETNSQAERTNQMLEQYLCIYCNYQQDNWSELLPLAEFAYNNAPSVTTGVSPFFANKEYYSHCIPRIGHSFLSCLWLHSWSWQTTKHTQRGNCQSPKTISTLHQLSSTTTPRLPNQTISICQITVFPDIVPIKKTLQKVPWTIWDNCSAKSTILHTLPSGYHESSSSHVSHHYARTSHIQHLPAALQTSASTCDHRRKTRIRNLQDS